MLDEKDIHQIEDHGVSLSDVESQLRFFREGFPFLEIISAASIKNGIIRTDDKENEAYAKVYDRYAENHKILKFVPASGAATRMFKELFEFLLSGKSNKTVNEVLVNYNSFAFSEELRQYIPDDPTAEQIISAIITGEGLNYGIQPKALILFHKYSDHVRTAFEEHLVEGASYAACCGNVNIHFTISPEHRAGFEKLLFAVLDTYQNRFGVEYTVCMSEQQSCTDTIAVNPDNTPFRNPDGSLLFRPAGHGALVRNLSDADADLIFIKNIDNVTTDSRRSDTIKYKKTLAGVLIDRQERCFSYLRALEADPVPALLDEIHDFIEVSLCVKLPDGIDMAAQHSRIEQYIKILDRPIRVCGMVLNEGEPGGGPVWAKNSDGTVSLQIAEPSQIAPEKQYLLKDSTHFNPVDIVCGVKNYKGEKFDLTRYVDISAGFISEKSKDGKPLRAQELPGLWNGTMSKWNTVFVEVPVTTFTPVKIVTDLLRPQHIENI